MAETNTRDVIGEKATFDGLIQGTLPQFIENSTIVFNQESALSYETALTKIQLSNATFKKKNGLSNCLNLNEIDIYTPDGDTGEGFARGCYNLKKISIASGNKVSFNQYFCADCFTLNALIVDCPTKPYFPSNWDSYTNLSVGTCPMYVRDDLVDQVKQDGNCSRVKVFSISEYPVPASAFQQTITDTWTEIQAAEDDGSYLTKYSLGDTKMQIIIRIMLNNEV